MLYRVRVVSTRVYISIDAKTFIEAQSIAFDHTLATREDAIVINDYDGNIVCSSVNTPYGVSISLCTTGSKEDLTK